MSEHNCSGIFGHGKKRFDNHGQAKNRQDRTCHISYNFALDFIGKLRADKGEEGGDHNGKNEEPPALQHDGGLNEDMAHRCNQRREGHNKCRGANGSLTLIAQHGSEHDEHHHTTVGAEKAGAKTNGQAKEQRYCDFLNGQLGFSTGVEAATDR